MNEDILKQFEESVARYQARPEKLKPVTYNGLDAKGYLPIAKKALKIAEGPWVEIHQGMREDGTSEIFHRLYDRSKINSLKDAKEGESVWTYNVSHPCPPNCGNGD